MSKLKRILAATDFSPLGDSALRRAALLAAREDAELLIVHAIPGTSALAEIFGSQDNLLARVRTVAEARLAALSKTAMDTGASRVFMEIVEGSARQAVKDVAGGFHPDLLVVGAHGRGILQQMFLGGTVSGVLVCVGCPVLVVRQAPHYDYRRALVAVDLGSRSEAVLRTALSTAGKASLTAIHAYIEAKLRYEVFSDKDLSQCKEPETRAVERKMRTLLADPELAGRNLECRIVQGHPNSVLPEAAKTLDADIIVAGRHSGSRIEEAVMGSVVRFLTYNSPCDVLVV